MLCRLTERDVFSKGDQLAPDLLQYFRFPSHLLTKVYRLSNGFFSSHEIFHEDGYLQSHRASVYPDSRLLLTSVLDTWFRFLVKDVTQDARGNYLWHEMTFCSRWTPEGCTVLCIGTPKLFQDLLHDTLSRMWPILPQSEPFSLHVPIVEAVVAMQDSSIWSVRDAVRSMEKVRAPSCQRTSYR